MKLKKTVSAGKPGTWKERLLIKTFKTREEGYEFLNKQDNNEWREYEGELKAGKYAFAGGKYHNVKTLDPSILAHI